MEGAPETAAVTSPGTGVIEDAEDTGFVPMYRLPPAERARNRAQMGRILDIFEEEERIEEERSQARDKEQRQEELERRKANAKAELERLKTAKEMQKKMGKALLKNMADAREKEEMERSRQEKEDLELEEARKSRKPRKSVSWAELPKQDKSSTRSDEDGAWAGDGARPPGKLPMRLTVVERFPTRSGASSPPPPVPLSDSDDESNPPSSDPSDSDSGGAVSSDGVPFPRQEHALSDGTEDEDGPVDSQGSEDGFDIDAMQHQREIALAYFEKRDAIGADAAHAMSAHFHDIGEEDEWEQEARAIFVSAWLDTGLTDVPEQDVPLEATLTGPRPKPSQSRFKSERLVQAYGTRLPSSTPPTSLGTSVLPNSASALRGTMRMGRLEAGQLVGNSDSDGEDDAARAREFVDALYRGDVTNAGAAENSDALIAALESAYGAPPEQPSPPVPPTVTASPVLASSTPTKTAPISQKNSRFKPARTVPPLFLADNEGPREGGASPSSQPPTNVTVVERKTVPVPVATVGSPPAPSQLPPMIVDSSSFAPPGGDAPMMVIDSPSFRPPLSSARPTRLPTVLTSVRESSGPQRQQQQQGPVPEPGKKVSRFKAQRTES